MVVYIGKVRFFKLPGMMAQTFSPALGWERQIELWECETSELLHNEFQDSQGYREKPGLKTKRLEAGVLEVQNHHDSE